MVRGKRAKDGNDEQASKASLEVDIINRIVLFYTNKDTTHEQQLKVWEAVEKIMLGPLDTPKSDNTGGG